jgi:hypothetical protein
MATFTVVVELFYSSAWNGISTYVYSPTRDQVRITRGLSDGVGLAGLAGPSQLGLTLNNRDGRFSPRNPRSPLFGLIGRNTPIRVSIDADVRFVGEVSEWPSEWTAGGADVWVPLRAAGISRRLLQGADPLESTVTRFARSNNAVGYWPLGDIPGSSQAASGLEGGAPLVPRLVSLFGAPLAPNTPLPWGQAEMFPHLPGGLLTPEMGSDNESVEMDGNTLAGASGSWAMDVLFRTTAPLGTDPAVTGGQALFFRVIDGDGNRWLLAKNRADPDELQVTLSDEGGASIDSSAAFDAGPISDGNPHHLRLQVVDAAGTTATVTVYVDGVSVLSDTFSGMPTTLTAPAAVKVSFRRDDGTPNLSLPVSFAHMVVWADSPPTVAAMLDAYRGHAGETAGRRIERLCDEEGVAFVGSGDLDDTQPLGPQYPDGFVAILREAAETDPGILHDARTSAALRYVTGRSLYNQDPTLELSYGATGELSSPPSPTDDDQQTRNDVTVTRRDGGRAQAVQESGPLNVSMPTADPQGVGRYTTSVQVNTMSDGLLPDHAGWRLHLGTVDETRYPQINLDLAAMGRAGKTALSAAAATLDVGSRLTIDNLPAWLPPDLVQQHTLGFVETLTQFGWDITVAGAPASPYRIGEVEHADLGMLLSDSAVTAEALDSTETGVDINAGAGPDWVHEADFDVIIGGERMTVTAVSAMAGTFPTRTCTLTVTRSVDGIVKSHATAAPITFLFPSFIGL